MSEEREVFRRAADDELDKSFAVSTSCRVCAKPIDLHFNGGELDQRECCGFVHRLESRGADYVIADRNPA